MQSYALHYPHSLIEKVTATELLPLLSSVHHHLQEHQSNSECWRHHPLANDGMVSSCVKVAVCVCGSELVWKLGVLTLSIPTVDP